MGWTYLITRKPASLPAVNPPQGAWTSWHKHWKHRVIIGITADSCLTPGSWSHCGPARYWGLMATSIRTVCPRELGYMGGRLPHVQAQIQVRLYPIIISSHRPEWHSWYLLTALRFMEDEALLVGVIAAELWAVSFLSCSTAFWEEEEVLITPWALS